MIASLCPEVSSSLGVRLNLQKSFFDEEEHVSHG